MVTKPEKSISILLDESSHLHYLLTKANNIMRLDEIVKQYLETDLKDCCRVVNFNHGVLVIATTNSAWATRLRFQSSSLIMKLRQPNLIPGIASIRISVLHESEPHKILQDNAKSIVLSPVACEQLQRIAEIIQD